MHRAEAQRLEQMIDREVRAGFGTDAIARVAVLRPGEDPAIGADELLVRVVIQPSAGPPPAAPGATPDAAGAGAAGAAAEAAGAVLDAQQRALAAWAQVHETGMRRLRRELSLRLPPARLLEFTTEDARGAGDGPRITMLDDPEQPDEPLPAAEIVAAVARHLRASYVFPDAAERAAAMLAEQLAAGAYEGLDEAALADLLTSQLYEVCGDKHLRVRAQPEPDGPGRPPRGGPGPGQPGPGQPGPGRGRGRMRPPEWPGPRERWRPGRDPHPEFRPLNFGIFRVERLAGNIGYLDVHMVADPRRAGTAIAAAMELVAGTYALIIDLRKNGGGSVQGAVLWCSYLFEGGDTHLNDVYHGDTGETRQLWSLPHLPGARYLDRPVYVLTSGRTFSGGEDIAYTLQAQGRAQVIGETTGGGAHPTQTMLISATMAVSVPNARSINPVTGTNWEGTGVVPDVAAPADQAYDVAYRLALQHVLAEAEAEPADEESEFPPAVPPPLVDEAREALAALEGASNNDSDSDSDGNA